MLSAICPPKPPPPLTGHSIAIYYLFSLSMIEEMFFFYSIIFYILLLKSALNALNNTSLPSIRILLSKSSKKNEMEFKKKKNRPVADLSNECRHLYQDNLKEKKKWVWNQAVTWEAKQKIKIQNERIHKGLKIFN